MIELNKKSSNKKKTKKNIKDSFEDFNKNDFPLNISNSLSSSLSDIDKITSKAKDIKAKFMKFVYIVLFIILIYILYKLYVSFIKKKPINKSTFDIESDIKKILDDFN